MLVYAAIIDRTTVKMVVTIMKVSSPGFLSKNIASSSKLTPPRGNSLKKPRGGFADKFKACRESFGFCVNQRVTKTLIAQTRKEVKKFFKKKPLPKLLRKGITLFCNKQVMIEITLASTAKKFNHYFLKQVKGSA